MNALEKQYTEKLEELNRNLTWQIITPESTTQISADEFQIMFDVERKLRTEIASLKKKIDREELDAGWKELENSGLDKPFEQEKPLPNDYVKTEYTQSIGSTTDFVMAEITDADIEAWAIESTNKLSIHGPSYIYSILDAKIEGAKAFRDGEIKHKEDEK